MSIDVREWILAILAFVLAVVLGFGYWLGMGWIVTFALELLSQEYDKSLFNTLWWVIFGLPFLIKSKKD